MTTFDVTEDVVSPIGVVGSGGAMPHEVGAAWDCSIGGMSFNFAISKERPLRRQTAEFRRERVDTEREPGEQSLDSGAWLRSQSSWHLGAGLVTAEPLESDSGEVRFRFRQSAGVDPWTPGRVSLLPATELASTDGDRFLLGVGDGVLHAGEESLWRTTSSGVTSELAWDGGSVTSLATNGTDYFVGTGSGIWRGDLSGGEPELWFNADKTALVRWVKSRIVAGIGPALFELTGAGPVLPDPIDPGTARPTGWAWTDFADFPSGVFAAGHAGCLSTIERVSLSDDGTLSPPVVVAEMPRSELVLSLYSYVGSYLIVGTNRGVRVAAIGSDGSLAVGPLLFETDDGVSDAVARDRFVWVTVGSKGQRSLRVNAPGLYRIDMGTSIESNELVFPYAPDMFADVDGSVTQVTMADCGLWFNVGGVGVFRPSSETVTEGWVETGRVRFGTVENKEWRSVRVLGELGMSGSVEARGRVIDVGDPASWDTAITVTGVTPDLRGKLNLIAPAPSSSLFLAFRLIRDDSGSPVLTGFQVKAMPAPERSDLLSVPLLMFDREKDRNGLPSGSSGWHWERFSALKSLERSAGTVQWVDNTTGERAEAFIERVDLVRESPSPRSASGVGGVVTVLLRLV